jgi:hypothetical protein
MVRVEREKSLRVSEDSVVGLGLWWACREEPPAIPDEALLMHCRAFLE